MTTTKKIDEEPCTHLRELHEFWFADYEGWGNEEFGKRWFMANEEFDKSLHDSFSGLANEAAQGNLDGCADQDRHLAAALVVALDQLPRNLHRGTAQAFACDDKALALAQRLVSEGNLEAMWPCERMFVLMPYQHSEDLAVQRESVRLFQQLADSAPEGEDEFLQGTVKYAQLHLDIVERFGRFPHRNKALGRETTEEEAAWLKGGGETFGQ